MPPLPEESSGRVLGALTITHADPLSHRNGTKADIAAFTIAQ